MLKPHSMGQPDAKKARLIVFYAMRAELLFLYALTSPTRLTISIGTGCQLNHFFRQRISRSRLASLSVRFLPLRVISMNSWWNSQSGTSPLILSPLSVSSS